MLDRDALIHMQLFLAVVDGGSLAAAARALRLTPSAVSKQLSRLERRLGVRLVERTTRSLRVTAAGTRYRRHARSLVATLADAEADVQAETRAVAGELRVSAPTLLGQEVVGPLAARFLLAHPEVCLELDLTERFVDLAAEPVDVALRVATRLPASGLAARRLGSFAGVIVASPDYLERRGAPRRAQDLAEHACLELAHDAERGRWRMTSGGRELAVEVRGPLVSSSLVALRRCALAGLGVARLPGYLVRDDLEQGRLVRLLPHVASARKAVFAVRAHAALVPPRVRAFIDFLAAELPAWIDPPRAPGR